MGCSNTEGPSIPLVRLASQSPNTEVCVTNVVNREDFKIFLSSVQLSHNGADYFPEIEIQKSCAETIEEDIEFFKEEPLIRIFQPFFETFFGGGRLWFGMFFVSLPNCPRPRTFFELPIQ